MARRKWTAGGFIGMVTVVLLSAAVPVFAQEGSQTPLYQEGHVLLEDDFEDGDARGWALETNWGVVQDDSGNYVLEARNTRWQEARQGKTDWQDYALEFKAKIIQSGAIPEIQVLVRRDTRRQGCQGFRLYLGGDTTFIVPDAGGDAIWNCFGQQTKSYSVNYVPNQWYSIRIEAFQTQIQVYVDGNRVISLDIDEPLYTGAITFIGTPDAIVQYDDVRVVELLPFGADAPAPLPDPPSPPPIFSVIGDTLFSEDFQTDAPADMVLDGAWYIESDSDGNRFLCNEPNENNLNVYYGDTGWSDYAVDLRLKFRSFNGTNPLTPDFNREDIYLNFRVNSGSEYAGLILASESGGGTGIGYSEDSSWDSFTGKGYDFTVNTWYTLRAEALGDQLRWYINDRLILRAHDSRLTNGSVGIAVSPNSEICIDDLRVQEMLVVTSERYVTIQAASANLRSGPGTSFDRMGVVPDGERFPVVSEADSGAEHWYQILLPSGTQGWIRSDLVIVSEAP